MESISNLKTTKTLKEYEFIKSEYDYVSSQNDKGDKEFMLGVEDFLSKNIELKELYKQSEREINITSNIKSVEKHKEDEDEAKEKTPKSKDFKSIYRKIVKQTHPDKTKDEKLNVLYKKASEYYNESDTPSLYLIGMDLDIPIKLTDKDLQRFEDDIKETKGKIGLIKGMFSYKWLDVKKRGEEDINNLIMDFIKIKLK